MQQSGNRAASDVHYLAGLLLLVAHAIDEDDCHPFTLGQTSDGRGDVNRDRRIHGDEGPDQFLRLVAPLMANVLESPTSGNSAQPGFQLGFVPKLFPMLSAMKKRLLGDVFRAVASTERTAQSREIGEVFVVVVVKSVPYPHQYAGSLHISKRGRTARNVDKQPKKQVALTPSKHYPRLQLRRTPWPGGSGGCGAGPALGRLNGQWMASWMSPRQMIPAVTRIVVQTMTPANIQTRRRRFGAPSIRATAVPIGGDMKSGDTSPQPGMP